MKLSKILSKRVLSLLIVGLFVFTAFAVIQSGGNQAQASPSASSSFTFPYQYGTPTVPSDVGAQGTQGPLVPVSQIGLDGHSVGYQGHVGPVNDTISDWTNIPVVEVTVQVYNGTTASHTTAIGQSVYLFNVTTSTYALGSKTNSGGKAYFNITEGYWQLGVNASSSAYINFMAQVHLDSTSLYTVYLLPSSYSSAPVGNGGTAGEIWYTTGPFLGLYNTQGFPNINVTLENASSSDAVLKKAITESNGSVEFTSVNTAYSYILVTTGYSQPLSGWTYYMGNSTSSILSFGNSTVISVMSLGNVKDSGGAQDISTGWTTSGSVTGTAFPSRNSPDWSLSANTVITGGTTFFGGYFYNNGYLMKFVNAIVYFNATYNGNFTAINSTVISIEMNYFNGAGMASNGNIYATHSFLALLEPNVQPYPYVNDSIMMVKQANPDFYSSNPSWEPLVYSSDLIFNSVMPASPRELLNSTILNSEIGYSLPTIVKTVNYTISENDFTNSSDYIVQGFVAGNMTISYDSFSSAYPSTNPLTADLSHSAHLDHDVFMNGSLYIVNKTNGHTPVNGHLDIENTTFCTIWYTSEITAQQVTMMNDTFLNPMMGGSRTLYLQRTFPSLQPTIYINGNATLEYSIVNWTGTQNGNSSIFITPSTASSSDVYLNVSHVLFPMVVSPGALIFSTWVHFSFSNNTLENGYDNITLNHIIMPGYDPPNAGSPIVMYPGTSYVTSTVVSHNDFNSMLFGLGGPEFVGDLNSNGYLTVSGNIFDPVEHLSNSSLYVSPSMFDVEAYFAKMVNITGNYFLNSNNVSKPILFGDNFNGTAFDIFPVHISNNHIFMGSYPAFPNQELSPLLTGNFTYLSYVIPQHTPEQPTLYYNDTGTYMFEGIQNLTSVAGYPGTGNFTPIVFTPDISVSSGIPVISYSNGLVGGPQPNFEWKGYNYSESVEPTYIKVGVNSSKAPSIDLQFSGVPGIKYLVQAFSQGSEFESFVENASSSGILNATYNPATMPLDPTFEVSPYVAPLPPYNPVQPTPPMNFFPAYVFYILLATSAAGVAAGIYIMIRRR